MASRRNSSFRSLKKINDSPKFYDQSDDLDAGFDADQNTINNPFSPTQHSQSTSKWSLNESWRKLQQIIENKDKQTNQLNKKEINSQELLSFSNDDRVDKLLSDYLDYTAPLQEGEEIQEGYDLAYNDSEVNEDSINKSNSNLNLIVNNSNDFNIITNSSNIPNSTFYTSTTTNLSTSKTTISTQSQQTILSPISKLNQDKKEDKPTHSFLFSKIKKNSSMEQLNDLEEKENEKELIDNKRNKDDLIKKNDPNNTNSSKLKTSAQVQFRQLTTNKQTPINTTQPFKNKQMNKIQEIDTSEISNNVFNRSNSTDSTNDFLKTIKQNRLKQNQKNQFEIDEPIPSLNYFMSYIVNLLRKNLSFFSFTSSLVTLIILIFAIQLSPLSSFANGFLIGIIFSFIFLIIVIIYALNFLFQKIDYENDLHERIMSGKRWKDFPAYKKTEKSDDKLTNILQQQNEIHEGKLFFI